MEILDKDPWGSKVIERYVSVSNSEIKAEKEQSDLEANFSTNLETKREMILMNLPRT